MTRDEEDFVAKERVEVVEGDIEAIRPYNQRLMNEWMQQAQWVASEINTLQPMNAWEFERQTMELSLIKIPTLHVVVLGTGDALLAAFESGIICRRQGLI